MCLPSRYHETSTFRRDRDLSFADCVIDATLVYNAELADVVHRIDELQSRCLARGARITAHGTEIKVVALACEAHGAEVELLALDFEDFNAKLDSRILKAIEDKFNDENLTRIVARLVEHKRDHEKGKKMAVLPATGGEHANGGSAAAGSGEEKGQEKGGKSKGERTAIAAVPSGKEE